MKFDYLPELKQIIREAGQIVLNLYDSPTGIEKKSDGTLVSDADKNSSEFIKEQLQKYFPSHAILDEESSDTGNRFTNDYCWIIDPLDGTREFLKRSEDFGIIIGLTYKHKPILGLAYKPVTDELFWAIQGEGAYKETKDAVEQLHVKETDDIELLISNSRSSPELEKIIQDVTPTAIIRKGGSLKTIDIATGNGTVFLCPITSTMHLWDFCGPQIILEEAGGRMTNLYGELIDYSAKETGNKKGIICSNRQIHQALLEEIKQQL